MADSSLHSKGMLKNSKILVNVDEALQDTLLVSYAIESKLFQGVLLDSTKRFLPCRLPEPGCTAPLPPPPVSLGSPKSNEPSEEDKLFYNIRQRFTYFQEKPAYFGTFHHPKKTKAKNPKMTVRLRPRQVLCTKCKSVCNENSENVNNFPNKNKKPDPPESSPRALFSENRRDNQLPNASPPTKLCPSFVQRIPRLPQSPIHNSVNGSIPPSIIRPEDNWIKPEDQKFDYISEKASDELIGSDITCEDILSDKVSDDILHSDRIPDELNSSDKACEDEVDKQMVLRKKRSVGSMEDLWDETVFEEAAKKAKTTPVIKISFGTQGEGTVLKIPSKVQLCSESETEDKQSTSPVSKASKRAMKKAKKEARKKSLPSSPKRHKSPSPSETYKKHKHKVKHKKKHKSDKPEEDMKDKCLKQKLSISLRRLTSTTYEKAESSDSSSSSEDIPDFPMTPSLEGYKDVCSCKSPDGGKLTKGDVVWGKVQGFPWWPGKIVRILVKQHSDKSWDRKAQIAWYGSSKESIMVCDQLSPFLAAYEVRYNRRKKSLSYKEAIRLATSDANGPQTDT